MTLNPLRFATEVNKQYLRYQLTSARLADKELARQFKEKLWHAHSPLFRGPYVSLNRAFEEGACVKDLVGEKLLHNRMVRIIRYANIYKHQENAIRAAHAGKDILLATGTGSGKTEAFLYPIISRCLQLNEEPNPPKGVVALLIYPMNALANDQLARLREYLVGTGVTFGMYTGDTPDDETGLTYEAKPLPRGTTPEEYRKLRDETKDRENFVLHPHEEQFTRKQIQANPPRILLVNKAILEYMLARGDDIRVLLDAPIEFIVMDEAHTNTGIYGSEVALLLRRLKALARPPKGSITHFATSATIVDEHHQDEARRFMSRLFGLREDNVIIIQEAYQGIHWPEDRYEIPVPPDPAAVLDRALRAVAMSVGPDRDKELEAVFQDLTGRPLPAGISIEKRLFQGLLHNDLAYWIDQVSIKVKPLGSFVEETWRATKRGLPGKGAEEELLIYLVLGALAESEDTPLFRPKLHYFVKGLEGAVVVLSKGDEKRKVAPVLFLSADQASKEYEHHREPTAFFPVVVCPQCGQHHYEQYVEGVTSGATEGLKGGEEVEGGILFRPDAKRLGRRILFTDEITQSAEEEGDGGSTKRHRPGQVCYYCGAIYIDDVNKCHHCERGAGLLPIKILDSVDRITSCPVCHYNQGFGATFHKDPFRALREVPVANVYVLAQEMLSEAEGEGRRLIVFADNRQEAAFQAGWMQDRARRYRFRQLLASKLVDYEKWREAPSSKPDISMEALLDSLMEQFKTDKGLPKVVAPEVYEEAGESHFDERLKRALRRFLTVQVLRELTASYNTRASLEAWGRLRVIYAGVDIDNPGIKQLAIKYKLKPETYVSWLEILLDGIRKRQMLHHRHVPIFSHTWDLRHDLVKNRYLPPIEFHPSGLKLEWESISESKPGEVKTWLGRGGRTAIQEWLRALKLPNDQEEAFLRDTWKLLVDELKLLIRLDALSYGDGGRIKSTQNVYQIDANCLGLIAQQERHVCEFCGRIYPRPTPNNSCSRYRCTKGRISCMKDEEPRDYDLILLEKNARESQPIFVMAEEHTAQVPGSHRARIEKAFKDGHGVNCLVATPTLELGVDIGALDMVLLRNVPPRSANYWQRAGRAGRRNRMAVIYTYARTTPHDLHYFKQPEALLGGAVQPPRFNLLNPVMIRKHIHAAILTHLHAELLESTDNWLKKVIPGLIGEVLFDNNRPREDLEIIVQPLRLALSDETRRNHILDRLVDTFKREGLENSSYFERSELTHYLDELPDDLKAAYQRPLSRLQWAYQQKVRLATKEANGNTLSDEETRFKLRCEETIRNLNPSRWPDEDRKRLQLQNYTLTVLSQEGFLPGHATSPDQVIASAERAYTRGWDPFEFNLSRPSPIALHEHLPGNRIYANGGKYQVAYYKLPATQEIKNPLQWIVDPERFQAQNREEVAAGYHNPAAKEIPSLPLVDSQLRFISHVDDIEITRFRMPSVIAGVLRRRHKGGTLYNLGSYKVEFRRGQYVTLLNLGPVRGREEKELGFPVCRVCGGVRSPYEREEAIEKFLEYHKKSCGEEPKRYIIHVNTTVDGLLFDSLPSAAHAASLGESLVVACSHLFDMEREDLKLLIMPRENDTWALFLYDPMPGGSGLLQQLLEKWPEIVKAAQSLLQHCPGACPKSCYDCLRTYYNQYYHDELDRAIAIPLLDEMKTMSGEGTIIEPIDEIADQEETDVDTNRWEKELKRIVTEEWGFHQFRPQITVQLPSINTHTTPDLAHEKAHIAIYLDGPIHDTKEQTEKDRFLRASLKTEGWHVIEILIQDFQNSKMMEMHQRDISQCIKRIEK